MKRIKKTNVLELLQEIKKAAQDIAKETEGPQETAVTMVMAAAITRETEAIEAVVEEMRSYAPSIFIEKGTGETSVGRDAVTLDRAALLDQVEREARAAAGRKNGYEMGAVANIRARIESLPYKEAESQEAILAAAVQIAAKTMQAAGLCRYNNPVKDCEKEYPPDREVCDRCIEGWLMAKAFAVVRADLPEPVTNGDAIRAMTDDELGAWLYKIMDQTTANWPKFCENRTECQQAMETGDLDAIKEEDCAACMTRWLQQTAEE